MKIFKHIGLLGLLVVLTFSSCNREIKKSKDKEEIQNIIRQVLLWADSANHIDLLPVISDKKDSIYIGFDLDQHKQNLDKLTSADFFATEFIRNYDQIILTLDKRLRAGEYEDWFVGDLPPFAFANDYNPWWNGQESFPPEYGVIELINLDSDKGEFDFVCSNKSSYWEGMEDYKMRFKVVKVNNKWKISYLEGFNF